MEACVHCDYIVCILSDNNENYRAIGAHGKFVWDRADFIVYL